MTTFTPVLLASLAVLAVSCGGESASDAVADSVAAPASAEVGVDVTVAATADMPVVGSELGSCDVAISGGIDASFSAPGGPSTAYSRYWFTEDELAASGATVADAPVFQLSCVGPDGLTVLVSLWDEAQVPFGAGEVLLGPNEVSVTSADVLTANGEPATLTLTQFDDARMVGSFEFTTPSSTGADALAGSVTFDLANPF